MFVNVAVGTEGVPSSAARRLTIGLQECPVPLAEVGALHEQIVVKHVVKDDSPLRLRTLEPNQRPTVEFGQDSAAFEVLEPIFLAPRVHDGLLRDPLVRWEDGKPSVESGGRWIITL